MPLCACEVAQGIGQRSPAAMDSRIAVAFATAAAGGAASATDAPGTPERSCRPSNRSQAGFTFAEAGGARLPAC